MSQSYTYPGQELEFFQKAVNWKTYFAAEIRPYIGNRVLEVGTGIGATTRLLNSGSAQKWVLLEPDPALASILQQKLSDRQLYPNCELRTQTVFDINDSEKFDTIIYIDVLEHIENDRRELERAFELLEPGGRLIVLSPAFQFLFSPFDKAIGHYRRYSARTLKEAAPSSFKLKKMKYLDSVGMFASLANRMLLRQSYPTEKQVRAWDRWMIPVSKLADKLFFYSFGKSILGVWEREAASY
jgi:ubiquinone/menaquinone biosynthesis C-methylase UbiE